MHLMLGWSSLGAGQSGGRRDTHGIAAAQLLQQELDGGQLGQPGSFHSFWWPVPGEGAEKEPCERDPSYLSPAPEGDFRAHGRATMPRASLHPPWCEHGPPGLGLPKERAEPELLQRPGAAARERGETA